MSIASRSASRLDPHWPALLERLSGVLDLDASARTSGALVRRRNVGDAATLLRLALAHGPGGLSLRSAATWAGASGVAELSDVALRRRLRKAADWLGQIAGALLSARLSSEHVVSTERLRIVDGSSISHAGANGAVLHGPGMQAQLPQPRSGVRRCGRRSGVPTPACGTMIAAAGWRWASAMETPS